MKSLKLYLETSSWNFYYADDAPEKKAITREFFDALPDNHYDIYISDVVLKEINKASENKAEQLKSLIKQCQPTTLMLSVGIHIANVHRQKKVNAINLLNGYTKALQLITPMEVSYDDS